MEKTSNSDISTNQFIIVRIGNEQYGINIKIVDNIVRMQQITRVPKAQKYFVGVINLRGEIVPAVFYMQYRFRAIHKKPHIKKLPV